RQLTTDELAAMRDGEVPYLLSMLNRCEVFLNAFAARSFENARRVREDLFGIQNSRKAFVGIQAALLDPEIWNSIAAREKRLRDSNKESLELDLFSTAPIYNDVEQITLADSLTDLAAAFGANDPRVQQVLAGKSPRDRAAELVKGAKLKDVAFRKQLYEGGAA